MTGAFVIGFVGRSGAGKTTLATAVARELVRRGRRVAALKDAHHGIDLDRPGKDTWRYREAGAMRVILRTAERWAVMGETPGGAEPVGNLLALAGDAEIVLVEGFKHEGRFPRIEVRRRAASREPPLLGADAAPEARAGLVAVATDFEEPGFEGTPRLDVDDPAAVADFIEALERRERT